MTTTQFLATLRARWRVLLLVWALCMALAVLLSLVLPQRWTAAASVVIDVKATDPISGGSAAAVLAPSYMATQVDIMQSQRVAARVVGSLRLTDSPAMREAFIDDTGGEGDFATWLARLLQRRLVVQPVRESNLLEVEFSSADPRFSVAVANGFARAYLDTVLDLRVEPARQYSAFFDSRLGELRQTLEAAQTRLSAFQKSRRIFAADERLDQETARLNELSSQLVALQAGSADSRSRQVAAGIAPDTLQDVINHPVVQGLRVDLARQHTRVQELAQRLGDAHPALQEAQAAAAELQARLDQEQQRLGASVGINGILSESREAQLRASLEAQRDRVLQLKGDRDELTVLQRDAELAQRAYDAVASRLTQMSLEGASEQTNATLLSQATLPSRPSFPFWPLNLSVGAIAGLLLGVAAALYRETADRRVRTPEDVARELKLPLLAEVMPQATTSQDSVELMRPLAARTPL